MEKILEYNDILNDFIWGPVMLFLLVGTGIYLTIRLKGFTIRRFGYVLKNTILGLFKKSDKKETEGQITAFQALSTAMAIGTGNVSGVAMAIVMGGPGAVFWMWISAIFGMATKFSEVVLSIQYREQTEDGRYVGGPMYYIKNGLKTNFLAIIFAVFASLAAFGIGNLVQSNAIAEALDLGFNIDPKLTGIVLALVSGLVISGGVKRIGSLAERILPIMSLIYITGGLAIILKNIKLLPSVFGLIFKSAFTSTAMGGAFIGINMKMAMRQGLARGVFSNEAGLGSSPIAHGAAKTDHPVRQGLWGIFEVFVDTIIICTITALTILITDSHLSGASGVALATMAFERGLNLVGKYIVTFGVLIFAFSMSLSWSYYGATSFEFLFGERATKLYKLAWIPMVYLGAVGGLNQVWSIADTLNGLMAIPNLIGVLGLSRVVIELTRDFFKKENIKF